MVHDITFSEDKNSNMSELHRVPPQPGKTAIDDREPGVTRRLPGPPSVGLLSTVTPLVLGLASCKRLRNGLDAVLLRRLGRQLMLFVRCLRSRSAMPP